MLLLAVTLFIGCGATVTPPAHLVHPAIVYVADYGRHSTLLLPDARGRVVEYTWGDWDWLGLNNRPWYLIVNPMLFSRASAFGHKWIDAAHFPPTAAVPTAQSLGCQTLLTIAVEQSILETVRNELDHRFIAAANTMVFSVEDQYCYVREPKYYGVFYECNDQTGDWLRELGCQVTGMTTSAHFRLAVHAKQ